MSQWVHPPRQARKRTSRSRGRTFLVAPAWKSCTSPKLLSECQSVVRVVTRRPFITSSARARLALKRDCPCLSDVVPANTYGKSRLMSRILPWPHDTGLRVRADIQALFPPLSALHSKQPPLPLLDVVRSNHCSDCCTRLAHGPTRPQQP